MCSLSLTHCIEDTLQIGVKHERATIGEQPLPPTIFAALLLLFILLNGFSDFMHTVEHIEPSNATDSGALKRVGNFRLWKHDNDDEDMAKHMCDTRHTIRP